MTSENRKIQDALLERYLAGDLPPDAKARVDAELDQSPADRTRLQDLRGDSSAFLLQHPAGPLVARFEKERSRIRSFNLFAFIAGGALAATTAGFFALVRPVDGFNEKGGIALTVYRKQGNSVERLGPGDSVAAGDALRFEVHAPQRGWVAVLGPDAAYQPVVPYDPRQPLMPNAIVLDAAAGPERIYALWGPEPFDAAEALAKLKVGQRLPGVASVEVDLPKR